jgi:thymidylate synthase
MKEIIFINLFKGWYLPSLYFFVNYFYFLAYHTHDDIISNRAKELEMTKTEVITMFMNAVGQYTTAIDKTAESNISYKKSVYALEDAVNLIYRNVDTKELGSNAEARNAKVSEKTQDLIVAKREAEYQLETARANESRIKAEVDQIKYIIRALEVKEEA